MRVFNEIMDFIEWLLIDNNTQGLKILIAWIALGLLFAFIQVWTQSL